MMVHGIHFLAFGFLVKIAMKTYFFLFIKKVYGEIGGCYSNYFLYKKLMETPDFQTIQNGKT